MNTFFSASASFVLSASDSISRVYSIQMSEMKSLNADSNSVIEGSCAGGGVSGSLLLSTEGSKSNRDVSSRYDCRRTGMSSPDRSYSKSV